MGRWIVVVAGVLGLAAGCGGVREDRDVDVREDLADAPEPAAPAAAAGQEGASPSPLAVDAGCWTADVELSEGGCGTAHALIGRALETCIANGGEATDVDVGAPCTGGFRAAAMTCCSAPSRVRSPLGGLPEHLPEPIGADPSDTRVGECSDSTAVSRETTDCSRDASVTESVIELIASHAASGLELRSFRYFGRCEDGGFAGFASSSCTPGYRRR